MYKKYLVIIIMSFLCTCMMACDNINTNKDDEIKLRTEPIVIGSHSSNNGILHRESDIVEAPEGYYMLSNKSISNQFIAYLDKDTNQTTVLCSKINCSHTITNVPSDCDARIGSTLPRTLVYYEGYLYYIGYNDSGKCTMCRVSSDGLEHEVICELGVVPDCASGYYSYIVTDRYIIYSESIGVSGQENTATINLYDIKTKNVDILYSYKANYGKISDLKTDGKYLYFRKVIGDGGIMSSELYKLDMENMICSFIDGEVCSYTINAVGVIAYWKVTEGAYEYNSSTESKRNICASDTGTENWLICCSNGQYYVYNFGCRNKSEQFIGVIESGNIINKFYYSGHNERITDFTGIGEDRILLRTVTESGMYFSYSYINDGIIDNAIVRADIFMQ